MSDATWVICGRDRFDRFVRMWRWIGINYGIVNGVTLKFG